MAALETQPWKVRLWGALCVAIVGITLIVAQLWRSDLLSHSARSNADSTRTAQDLILRHKCGSCHTLKTAGLSLNGKVGPDLSHQALRERSDRWLDRQLTDPESIPDSEVVHGFEGTQKLMPSFAQMTDSERAKLIDFLQRLRQDAAAADSLARSLSGAGRKERPENLYDLWPTRFLETLVPVEGKPAQAK